MPLSQNRHQKTCRPRLVRSGSSSMFCMRAANRNSMRCSRPQPDAGLVVGPDPFFNSRIEQLATPTIRHALPVVYQWREFVAAGGLLSYGNSGTDVYRRAGVYTGRILKGEKPADLPVEQTMKIELFINLKSQRARHFCANRSDCPRRRAR